ncbi:MAG: hypothetical protein QOE08_1317, partial [Thermoleophilaceae bacterium]|nr:hypothetical protein [Thermoleophilaceae bacterium]
MDFRILGPLEVEDEGRRVALGGAKQRALLAHLLLHPNEVVSSDVLIAALWGQDGRHGSSKALQIAVSRLRRALEPELADGRESRVLVTRPPGYELKVATGELDLERFEQGVASGREALHAGDAATAARRLREALALWRGPPLADLAYERFPPADAARLDDLRLSATEGRVAADLELGRHAELTGELERLVADHPYRERLWRALMLALYRSGRQADALDVYARMRRVLVEELGIEPSRELKDLQRGILAHDAALELEPPPEAWEGFVGRKREMARLLGALDSSLAGAGATVLVGGEPGIGKSRLAEELAARARKRHSRVLVGRCWEAGGAPPYWPWVQVLRAYARDTGEAALSSMVAQAGAELATVLPEIGDLVAHPPPAA